MRPIHTSSHLPTRSTASPSNRAPQKETEPSDSLSIEVFEANPKQHAKAVDELSRQVFGTGLDLKQALRNTNQMALVAVNQATGGIVGAVLLECGSCLDKKETLGVWSLMVDPQVQRGGVGRKLMERALAEGEARGYPSSTLVISKDNRPARSLYEKLGYQIVGVPDSSAASHQDIELPPNPRLMVRGKPIPSQHHEVTASGGKKNKKDKKAKRSRH